MLATPAKQPVKAPPLDSGLAETISVKNQCPPLEESYRQEGSPPLLQCFFVSPMIVSSEIGADWRARAVLKTRISPMLLVSTTDPLPAHRPWSGGSTSLKMLVVCVALSTTFRPFTAVAPPAEALMLSQPGPRGTQLTDGSGLAGLLASSWRRCAAEISSCRESGGGIARAVSGFPACRAVPTWWPDAAAPVDGVLTGPLSREQLVAQPVAAGPAKVGLNDPRLDEAIAPPELLCGAAAAGPPMATRSIAGRDSSDSSTAIL